MHYVRIESAQHSDQLRGRGTPRGSDVIFGNIRDGTRCTRTRSCSLSAGGSPGGVSGAMTMTS